MLSLKDFKNFEVNNSLLVNGGAQGPTTHSSGKADMIYEKDGVERFDIGGEEAGCLCTDRDTPYYSEACC